TFATETLVVAARVNVETVAVAVTLCVLTYGLRYVCEKTGPEPEDVCPSPQERLYVGAASLTFGSDRFIVSAYAAPCETDVPPEIEKLGVASTTLTVLVAVKLPFSLAAV